MCTARKHLLRPTPNKYFSEIFSDEDITSCRLTNVYADHADLQNDTLLGVIVTEMKDNEISEIRTAEFAKVNFNTHGKRNEVQILVYKPSHIGEEVKGEVERSSLTTEFGSLLGDDIKFKKIDEMRKIQADLMWFYPIEKLARETYAQFTVELLAQDINKSIDGTVERGEMLPGTVSDTNSFYELLGEPNSVKFTAGQYTVQDGQIELSGENEVTAGENEVTVIEYDTKSKQPLHIWRCPKASLHLEGDELTPTLTMDIHNVQEEGSPQLRMRYIIRGLVLPEAVEAVANEFKTEDGSLRAEKLASELSKPSKLQPSTSLGTLQSSLLRRILKTRVEIKSEMHSRLVFGIGCVPMILIGIGLGIIKKGGHLLTAFGASCVPAAVLIVCIMSGKQIIENLAAQTVSGVQLMWAGLGFLSLLAIVIYSWLLKY